MFEGIEERRLAVGEAELYLRLGGDGPLLVLWGRRYLAAKEASPLATWREWAEDAREVALDCGHFIAEEEPEACAAALREFFLEA